MLRLRGCAVARLFDGASREAQVSQMNGGSRSATEFATGADGQSASDGIASIERNEAASPNEVPGEATFPIVAIGASAGGLEVFTQLLKNLPGDTGMAFVLLQHLDPQHESFLAGALGKVTPMAVSQALDGERAEPNHVYVIPPDADLSISRGSFALLRRSPDSPKLHLPIDSFFTSLAMERGRRAIGVVLSGNASDGTEGLQAIKAQGGITLAQDPSTAKFAGMPQSAIDAGVVDYVLPVTGVAEELARLSRHPYVTREASEIVAARGLPGPDAASEVVRNGIMNIVRSVVGVDFREYKSPTFDRRLSRRMALRHVDLQSDYLDLLRCDAEEVRALTEDILIHVSSFFRDPAAFETIKRSVFPEILKHKVEEGPIRIWVAGCAAGEEVYSLAMCLLEFLRDSPREHSIQIFGSDVSEASIRKARAGRYAEGAMRGVSDERRRRFFIKTEAGYRINKNVRDLCVFVRHDLARDPPFSRLDLVTCRNVLIYFEPALQKRVLQTFHYSLTQPGFLLLGRTENVSGFNQLFAPFDKLGKIYLRSATPSGLHFAARSPAPPASGQAGPSFFSDQPRRAGDVGRHLDSLLLARYAPASVLINEKLEILQFRGQTGPYLQAAPGEPQTNIVKMARPGLLPALRTILARAKKEMAPVRSDAIAIDQGGFTRTCDVVVVPFSGLPDQTERLFVVLFEERLSPPPAAPGPAPSPGAIPGPAQDAGRIPKLEHELSSTTEYLHSLIEEHGQINDELGSANEELISGNEELQSLNEELETAKEELQSTNEELTTVNDELQHRNQEMSSINSDLTNLLNTVDLPVVILDQGRHVRRFTPQAQKLFNLLPSDIGRLFDDIKSNLAVSDLDQQIRQVITTFSARESELQDREGRWYRLQIRPYKAADERIDGAIVSLVDIDALKGHVIDARARQADAERSDRAKDEFLAVLSHELRTPLSVLVMQTQLLRQGGADPLKRERACERIERSTKLQIRLIEDLLDVSRIVTGTMRVELQPVNLAAIVKASVDSVAALAASKSIDLRVTLDHAMDLVAGDRLRLEQIVSNLLANALKFTPKMGRIEVLLERTAQGAHLRVSDTGVGIDGAFLPRIFNRLTQQDSSTTRRHSGLGLGLAIVHHLVEAHGGSVRAESEGTGKGATFEVTIPFLKDYGAELPGKTMEQARLRAAPPRPPIEARILVVEDDVGLSEVLAESLTLMGATVRTADSAAVGLLVLQEFHPDLLICDIAMPDEDGYSFIARVRALAGRNGVTPALALTALAGDSDRERALGSGFQAHLTKPVDIDQLASTLSTLIPHRSLGESMTT